MSDGARPSAGTTQPEDNPCPFCGEVVADKFEAYHHIHTEHPDKAKDPIRGDDS